MKNSMGHGLAQCYEEVTMHRKHDDILMIQGGRREGNDRVVNMLEECVH